MLYHEFNRNRAKWDRYSAPHIEVRGGFVHFASGELIYTDGDPNPDDRHLYRNFGIQIVSTADDKCPNLYLTEGAKKSLPKAWLNQSGQQHLAVDLEQGVAVRLARSIYSRYAGSPSGDVRLRDIDHHVPHYLTGCFVAYWAGPGRLPVGDPITVSEPYRPTREERQHLQDLKNQATAWAAMKDLPEYAYLGNQNIPAQQPAHTYFDTAFSELTEPMRKSLHYYGWSTFRVETKYPYLYVRTS